jgi:hypothetical protein
MANEGIEQRSIKRVALRMVLDAQAEGIIPQVRLFDHIVVSAPCLNFQARSKLVEGLMVGTINEGNLDGGPLDISQGLYVLKLELGVVGNVEMERAPECNIQYLQSAANGEEGKPALKRFRENLEFPCITRRIGIFNQLRIRNGLSQEFPGNIFASGQEKSVVFFWERFRPSVPKTEIGIATEDAFKRRFVSGPNPCGDLFQLVTLAQKEAARIPIALLYITFVG